MLTDSIKRHDLLKIIILIPLIFKLGKWLNVVGSVKRRLDLVPVMRAFWGIIITSQKKGMIHVIRITRADEHYRNKLGWLDTIHHFSFGEYFDPNKMNFGPLRVFNDDIIFSGRGFDFHQHSDMEIVTYVIHGTLEHKDSLGNTGVVEVGEVQRMSAGTGIMHSEYNGSKSDQLRLLQIWIFPNKKNLVPSWEQKKFSKEESLNKLLLVVAPDDTMTEKSLHIHQNVYFFVSSLSEGALVERKLDLSRKAYLFVIDGKLEINGNIMKTRDAARIENEKILSIEASMPTELLLIDLPEKYAYNQ